MAFVSVSSVAKTNKSGVYLARQSMSRTDEDATCLVEPCSDFVATLSEGPEELKKHTGWFSR